MVLRKSFYIHWSAGRSPRVHEVNPGRDPSAAMFNLPVVLANSADYRQWPHPSSWEMVHLLSRDMTVEPILFRW